MNRFRESGAAGLTNTRRGLPGTHRIDIALRHRILTLLRGPILAAEKVPHSRHKPGFISLDINATVWVNWSSLAGFS